MKKIGKILLALSTSFLLAGCPKTNTKTEILYGSYVDTTLRSITQAKLEEMVNSKQSFLLAVSPKTQGCMCWHEFKKILESYIVDEHMIVYEINYSDFFDAQGKQLDKFGLEIHENEETFAIFDKGILKHSEVYDANNGMFKQPSVFKKYMDERTSAPHMYFVGLEEMDERIKEEKKAIIYFARNNCPDCTYVDKNFLPTYSFTHTNDRMYILDCETIGIREYAVDEQGKPTPYLTPESQQAWNQFKEYYQLAESTSPEYGYSTGVVPTFQLREYDEEAMMKSKVIDASVYFNDGRIMKSEGGDYIVSDSFYSEERSQYLPYEHVVLKNKHLSRDEVSENSYEKDGEMITVVSWLKASQAKYHNQNLKSFLDYTYKELAK